MNSTVMKNLFKAISKIETEGEAKKFFRDLCTISELTAMSERFEVVQQVTEGIPYRTINKKTGVSTATITRVAHWLHHGMGGYKLVLDRMKS